LAGRSHRFEEDGVVEAGCAPSTGHAHGYTDGSGKPVESEGEVIEKFGGEMYTLDLCVGEGGVEEEFSNEYSCIWENGKQTVANGELFAVAEILELGLRPGITDLFIFTDSMVTFHLIRKGVHKPWMLIGHEHEGTITSLLENIREKESHGITVHLHKVLAQSGVGGDEKADTTANLTCDEEGSAEMARGRVKAVKEYPFWIQIKGTGTKLEDRQSVSVAVREARQEEVAENVNAGP
jgi:ribonuclease HI